MRHLIRLALPASLSLAPACVIQEPTDQTPGTTDQACIPGEESCQCNSGQCLGGLECVSNVCVDLPDYSTTGVETTSGSVDSTTGQPESTDEGVDEESGTACGEDDDCDGDGYTPGQGDCDDHNSGIRPLEENATNYITQDTSVCPGIYTSARVVIENQNGITLNGSEATLDMDGSFSDEDSYPEDPISAIRIENSSDIAMQNFNISNYGNQQAAVYAVDVNNLTLNNVNVSDTFYLPAIQSRLRGLDIVNTSNLTIQNSTLDGVGVDIFVEGGNEAVLQNNNVINQGEDDLFGPVTILVIDCPNSLIQGNELYGGGLTMHSSNNSVISNNDLVGEGGWGIALGDSFEVTNNEVHQFAIAVVIAENSEGTITGNDFSNNTQCWNNSPPPGVNWSNNTGC